MAKVSGSGPVCNFSLADTIIVFVIVWLEEARVPVAFTIAVSLGLLRLMWLMLTFEHMLIKEC